ncbi:TauD/TfdA family dioxygenase [Siccirubricoccus sp. G192]|uniref:TauD/TfdA family dioxygenase n=1 Tax=Siccirubricoccus sp. G192 TaxID=2849651 RepID=UPI001C2C5134|nr:TauD/TfdA family dioxygenase [Siccirubricoccus sp. G192]MBV1798152.1 TauD/TfdA family dioxygenase [Siccirubricoccus sp. G192]
MAGPIRLQPITEPAAWTRAEMEADPSWRIRLTPPQIAALDRALAAVKVRGLPFHAIAPADFPLPEWEVLLGAVRHQLAWGRGVALLQGLQVERYSDADAHLLFWGIGTHLGQGVTQNAAAELIAGVYDRGLRYGDPDVRAYQVNAELSMHCDNSDIVGLFCLRQAKAGGETLLASALAIYNRILAEHPEYLPLLHSGFVYDRKGEQGEGEPPVSQKIPLFSTARDGTVSARYARSYITQAEWRTGIRLSPLEKAALDFFDCTALDPELLLESHLQPGDMEFANNYTVFHARRGYEDHADPARRRHMLRLWLQDDALRRIEDDQLRFGFTRFGNHGKTARELHGALEEAR